MKELVLNQNTIECIKTEAIQSVRKLIEEAKDLLEKGSYKSANNRAFYAIEKYIRESLHT